VSEQISLAGKEASGTGNMKFTMNGALTIGTLDGANVEIREAVGAENFFLFGMDTAQVQARYAAGWRPAEAIERSPRLKAAIDLIASGFFSPDDPRRFDSVVQDLWHNDTYMVTGDFDAYAECHDEVAAAYGDRSRWAKMVVHNLANVGRFSSDRTIDQYAKEIWGLRRVDISPE
jgi:glycogen phosphorylase